MNKKVIIIDYKMNNLFSIYNAVKYLNYDVEVASSKNKINDANVIILPGVGAFPNAINRLNKLNLVNNILSNVKSGKKIIGICLGMQLMFDQSEEITKTDGLGILKGKIISFKSKKNNINVPHVGWNSMIIKDLEKNKLKKFHNKNFYFVHSFFPSTKEKKISKIYTNYSGILFPSLIMKENIIACQFHPEKSGKDGLQLLNLFLK